jgi:CRP/FNR family transcriptional regulator, nitrogen fixation regulation protein
VPTTSKKRRAKGRKRVRRPPAAPRTSRPRPIDLTGQLASFARNEKIFDKGERPQHLYKVESGCIRTYGMLNGGRRWIDRFYLPGDIFGLEARENHSISAEAIVPSSIRLINRTALVSRAARDIAVARYLLDMTAIELQRTQHHKLLLLKGAQERIVDFLLEMKSRKQSEDEVDLPMARLDIADYLGLSIETVSRVLTRLKSTSAISLRTSRCVILRNLSVLEESRPALSTQASVGEPGVCL